MIKSKSSFILNFLDNLITLLIIATLLLGLIAEPPLEISLFAYSLLLFLISNLLCAYKIGIKFDQRFQNMLETNPGPNLRLGFNASRRWWLRLRSVRAMMYTHCITFPAIMKKNNKIKRFWYGGFDFSGFDFKKECSNLDLILAYTASCSLYLWIIITLACGLARYFK